MAEVGKVPKKSVQEEVAVAVLVDAVCCTHRLDPGRSNAFMFFRIYLLGGLKGV
jgi:hypothetical protein